MEKTRIGFIGVGAISGIYLENITNMFPDMEVYAVYDLLEERAAAAQETYHIPKRYTSLDQMLADPAVDIVLNLTRPSEHYAVTKAALLAGKPVYSEKPLAATVAEGRELAALAAEKGLALGGAPDTFLGAGLQTCRKLIEDGYIGRPVGAAAFMLCHGHESWHPDPAFYYKRGGGPMMDMGPYYLTALTALLGSVTEVTGTARKSLEQRTVTSQPRRGEVIDVEVPTHVNGILQFESGAVGTVATSFDVYYPQQARLEIYGTEGTLFLPDPNCFGGPVKLFKPTDGEVREIPLCFDYRENARALGLDGMAAALREGKRDFSCDCRRTLHVLELLEKLAQGGTHTIESRL